MLQTSIRRQINAPSKPKSSKKTPTTDTLPVEDLNGVQLYSCPQEGCVETFQRYYNLEQHLLYDKCEMAIERYSLLDTAKQMYNKHLVQGSTTEHPNIPSSNVSSSTQEDLEEGWALKSTKSTACFSVNQKTYLDDKFEIGQQTGNKADPIQISQDMRPTKNADGRRRFAVDECLTPQQIQSYFSRKAKKIKNCSTQPNLDQYDLAAAEEETAYHREP